MYQSKDCVENILEYIEEEVKLLYETFSRQSMTKLTDVQKREYVAAEKCHICLKEFNNPRNRKVRDHCHYTGLYRGTVIATWNFEYQTTFPLCFITWVVMTLICLSRN